MELQSDLVPGLEFAAIQTDLVSAVEPAGAEDTTTVLQQAPRYVTTPTVLPLRLAAFSGVRRGPNTLRVRLLGHDGSLVLEQWLVIDIGGSTTGTVVMTRSCKGVSCPGSGDPIAAIACLGGKCQDPRCSPEQPDFCSQPECTSAADCPAVAPCAEQRCDFGTCLSIAQRFSCAADSYCAADLGCRSVVCGDTGGDGQPCVDNADCTETCVSGTCRALGGLNDLCDLGDSDDCSAGLECSDGTCLGSTGFGCSADTECVGNCNGTNCVPPDQPDGVGCDENSDCANTCINGVCAPLAGSGGLCDATDDCVAAATCVGGRCETSVPIPTFRAPSAVVVIGLRELAVGDLNQDGNLDVVAIQGGTADRLVVLLGDGTGALIPSAFSGTTGSDPQRVILEDVNQDGNLDAVTAHDQSDDVGVFLGVGDGSFLPVRIVAAASFGSDLAAGDINGDGFIDLVGVDGTGGSPGTMGVLLGDGTGNFGSVSPDLAVGESPQSVALGDFNTDGNLDAALCTQGNGIEVSLGTGDGSFVPQPSLGLAGTNDCSVAVGDINGDSTLDLVGGIGSVLQTLTGAGDGTFSVDPPISDFAYQLGLVDTNADGALDIVVAESTNGAGGVYRGSGDGSFAARQPLGLSRRLEFGDLNNDGHVDVVSADNGAVRVVMGFGDGNFSGAARYIPNRAWSPLEIQVADFNEDGFPDLISPRTDQFSPGAPGIIVFFGGAGGVFRDSVVTTSDLVSTVAVGEITGDGHLDFIAASSGTDIVQIFAGAGDGTFTAGASFATGESPIACALDDFNADGNLDGLVVNQGSGDVNIFLGTGTGSFTAGPVYPVGDGPREVAVGDVNRDGHVDFITANRVSADVSLAFGGGDGTFSIRVASLPDLTDQPHDVALADLNGDRQLDLVVAGRTGQDVFIYLGAPGPVFSLRQRLKVDAGGAARIRLVDVNKDGTADLLVGRDYLTLALGTGDGRFEIEDTYGVRATTDFAVADVDRDGDEDLMAVDFFQRSLRVLLQLP